VAESISIPSRFNGPQSSGQGGYASGIISAFFDGPAEVTLRSPVPLETPLDVARERDGSLRVLEGETLVAEARPVELDLDMPEPVGVEEARMAAERYRGSADGLFGHCFVCGRGRDDSMKVFAGAVEGRDVVATPWTPPEWAADEDGRVLPEFVWAVLDCPTYFAVYPGPELPVSFLGRLAARIDAPVKVGEEHVVISWPIGADGRKREAGAALLSADGAPLAVARALMIEAREQPAE
jgi:hypothetical protein